MERRQRGREVKRVYLYRIEGKSLGVLFAVVRFVFFLVEEWERKERRKCANSEWMRIRNALFLKDRIDITAS